MNHCQKPEVEDETKCAPSGTANCKKPDDDLVRKFLAIVENHRCPKHFQCLKMDDKQFASMEKFGTFLKCPAEDCDCEFHLPDVEETYCLCTVANYFVRIIDDAGKILEIKKLWNLKSVMEEASPCEFWVPTGHQEGYCKLLGEDNKECEFRKSFGFRTCEVWLSRNKPPVLIAEITFG